IIVAGTDAGVPGEVKVYAAGTLALKFDFLPFGFFTGGVRVAAGDVNGDGVGGIIVGAGPRGAPGVKGFDRRHSGPLGVFFAVGGAFNGGVFVAAGDVNKDGAADIIVGADAGGASEVQVFNGRNGAMMLDFFAYGAFAGGVRVGAADINGDGFADIITGAGPG